MGVFHTASLPLILMSDSRVQETRLKRAPRGATEQGLIATAATPRDNIDHLHCEIVTILRMREILAD
jgi:hypothetical protein